MCQMAKVKQSSQLSVGGASGFASSREVHSCGSSLYCGETPALQAASRLLLQSDDGAKACNWRAISWLIQQSLQHTRS